MAVKLSRTLGEVRKSLVECQASGLSLMSLPYGSPDEVKLLRARYLGWESRSSAVLEQCFSVSGFMASGPKEEFNATAVSLLDLKIAGTSIPAERVPELRRDIEEKLRVLASVEDRLDVYDIGSGQTESLKSDTRHDGPIFLVHGHDLVVRESVRRFVSTIVDREVIVLEDKENRGMDLLGKLLANAEKAGFAIVLLSADDVGGVTPEVLQPRARQNVVMELGLFIGMLGRDRVAALYAPNVELPSDFSGVVYIPMDGDRWQIPLAREMRACGITVNLDNVI